VNYDADKPAGRFVRHSQRLGILVALAAYGISVVWVLQNSSARRVIDPDIRELTVAHWQLEDGYREGMEEIIRRYEEMKAKEGVKVRITQSTVPWRAYLQWFTTQMVAGEPADVIETVTSEQASRYATPLDRYVGRPNPYNKGTPVEPLTWRDSLIGFDRNMRAGSYVWVYTSASLARIFGNLDLIEQATGSRKMPETLTEWLEICRQVKEYGERTQQPVIPIAVEGFGKGTIRQLFEHYFAVLNKELQLQETAEGYGMNNQAFALALLEGRLDKYEDSIWSAAEITCELGRYFPEGFIALDAETSSAQFMQGRVAFMLAGTSQALGVMNNALFEVGVVPWPEVDPASRWHKYYDGPLSEIGAGCTGAYMVPRRSRNVDLAIDFLLFMTSYEMNQLLNTSCKWTPLVREARYEGIPESFRPNLAGNAWSFSPLGYGTYSRKMMEKIEDLIIQPAERGPDGKPRARNVREEMARASLELLREHEAQDFHEAFLGRARTALFGQENTRAKAICLGFRPAASPEEIARAKRARHMVTEEKGNVLGWLRVRRIDRLLQRGEKGKEASDGR
jgi:ABC-type glycerol-3-phosphate transport system substrate-binding protein